MMKKHIIILVLVLLILVSGIGIVSAETVTGTLGQSGVNQTTWDLTYAYTVGWPGATQYYPINFVSTPDFQNTGKVLSLIAFDVTGGNHFTFDTGAPSGVSIPVTVRISNSNHDLLDGAVIGTGSIGYQRYYNTENPPVEQNGGYIYIVMDSWNKSTYTGTQYLYFDYNKSALYNASWTDSTCFGTGCQVPAAGRINWGGIGNWQLAGSFILNKDIDVFSEYTVSKPAGLMISGSVSKLSGGETYNSQIFITNSTGAVITSESTASANTFNFTVANEQIKICMYSDGTWFNSSTLFSTITPTVTPTVTPTITLNPGEFWLTFSAEDATTGGLIPGAEIDIYSEFAGTWNNATTTSGERTIASSQGHVYDAYGSASGYTNGSALDKIAYPNQNYLVKLFPSTGLPDVPGYVNLFVSVTERETGSPISGVSVTVSTPGSYTVNGETDNTGSEVFSTSNSSVKYITVSKTGYKAETRTITTPTSGNYNAVLQMSRIVVTTVPTGYIPPGGVTPVTTMDSRSTTEKDEDMMNLIRNSGPQLISLAIAVTMISLLGLMTKGFGK